MTGAKVDLYFDPGNVTGRFSILTRSRGTGPLMYWTGRQNQEWTADIALCLGYPRLQKAVEAVQSLFRGTAVACRPILTAHCLILPSNLMLVGEYELQVAWLDSARTWGDQFWRIPMGCPICESVRISCTFNPGDRQEISCSSCGHRVGCQAHQSAHCPHRRWAALQDAIEIWNAQHWQRRRR